MLARLLTTLVIAAAAVTAAPVTSAVADPCPDVELAFARGTNQPPGLGRAGNAVAAALPPLLGGRTLGTYAVNYPASMNLFTAGVGADDIRAHIASMAGECPNTRIVLGGTSQGAAVISMLAGVPPVGDRVGFLGSAPPLAPDLSERVAAVVVFGNPAARFGHPLSSTGQFVGRAIDLCRPGDPICSDGLDTSAHNEYDLPPYPDQAARFIAGLV